MGVVKESNSSGSDHKKFFWERDRYTAAKKIRRALTLKSWISVFKTKALLWEQAMNVQWDEGIDS